MRASKIAISFCIFFLGRFSNAAICGQSLNSEIPIFQNALDNISSFTYVRQNLVAERGSVSGSDFCVSSVALGNNIYQYFHYFIRVEVRKPIPLRSRYFQFLFQDASVQAFQNIGAQPWIGLETKALSDVASNFIRNAYFTAVQSSSRDVLELSKSSQSYRNSLATTDPQTLSSVLIQDAQEKIYLVTWLSRPNENPFLYPVVVRGVLISISPSAGVKMAENISPNADFWAPLQESVIKMNNSLSRDQATWLKKLNEISTE